MALLESTGLDLHWLDTIVVGASNIVGRQMALELLLAGCTTTVTHRFTHDLSEHIKTCRSNCGGDGHYRPVKGAWIKEGALVTDVDINRQTDGKLAGDVEFDVAVQRAG